MQLLYSSRLAWAGGHALNEMMPGSLLT